MNLTDKKAEKLTGNTTEKMPIYKGISEILSKLTDICRNRRQILLVQAWGTPLGIPKE